MVDPNLSDATKARIEAALGDVVDRVGELARDGGASEEIADLGRAAESLARLLAPLPEDFPAPMPEEVPEDG